MNYKRNNIIIFIIFFLFCVSCDNNKNSSGKIYSKNICSEAIAPFYYESKNIDAKKQLKELCRCMWEKLPEGGWERKTSTLLHQGKDIGWKIKSFSTIFENNYKNCKSELSLN